MLKIESSPADFLRSEKANAALRRRWSAGCSFFSERTRPSEVVFPCHNNAFPYRVRMNILFHPNRDGADLAVVAEADDFLWALGLPEDSELLFDASGSLSAAKH